MALLLRDGYRTTISEVTFNITDSQFKGPGDGSGDTPLRYNQFFGLGNGLDDLNYTSFQLGGPVEVWIPIAGDTEIFRAQINGAIGASFGLRVISELNEGTISATLPYELSVSYPDSRLLEDGEIFGLYFLSEFENRDGAGFQTDFPSLTFSLNLEAALDVNLSATLGVLGYNDTFNILDFDVSTSVPLVSLDTARPSSEGGPIDVLGWTAEEFVEQVPGVEVATGKNDEFGLKVNFAEFLPTGKGKKDATVDKKSGDTKASSQDSESDLLDELIKGTDIGSLQIFIPNINTVSTFADGVFITDPSRRVDEDGNVVTVENFDPNDNVGPAGNRSDLAVLTADLDGIVSYATGFAFPPLEYEFPDVGLQLGPVSFDASFSYNLFDVELEAALPLEQEFTLTPQIATRLKFFEADPDGSGPKLDQATGNPIAKDVQVAQIVKELVFVESGAIQSDAVAQRLREISEESLTAAQENTVAEDIALFVDFDAGIPAGFTGKTASIGGRLVFRESDQANWIPLVNGDILLRSAPALGEDQQEELSLDGLKLAYQIERDDLPGDVFEYIPVTLEEAQGALREQEIEVFEAITETPYLTDLSALNLVYDTQSKTHVQVEHKANPIVTNRTGLEFDLSLLLEGLAASAGFSASVDVGPVTISAGVDFDIGPLFSERLPLFNAELVDLYNATFAIEEIAKNATTSFTIGEEAGETDFGDALVGTENNDVLEGEGDTDDVIAGLAGADILRGGLGDDVVFGGTGNDILEGGDDPEGFDSAVFTDLAFTLNNGLEGDLKDSSRIGVNVNDDFLDYTQPDGSVYYRSYHQVAHFASGVPNNESDLDQVIGFELLRLTDYGDLVRLDDLGHASSMLQELDTLGGDDVIFLEIDSHEGSGASLRVNAGAGNDIVHYSSTGITSTGVLDGGGGTDEIRISGDLDLSSGIGPDGVKILNFENVTREGGAPGTVIGDAGDNVLTGSFSHDRLIGGDGDDTFYSNGLGISPFSRDTMVGGRGADTFYGWGSYVTVDYTDSETSIFIDYDRQTGVGRGYRGEAQGDRLVDIERIVGSRFDDIIIGGPRQQTLEGGAGNDRIEAGHRSDQLLGGDGDDLLRAMPANKTIENNLYDGGDGFDIIAVEVVDPYRSSDTGVASGTTSFAYEEWRLFQGTLYRQETGTVNVRFKYDLAEFVEIRLDEAGDGLVEYFRQYDPGSARAISYYGTGVFAEINWAGEYYRGTIAYDNPLREWTFERLEGANFSYPPLDAKRASGDVHYNARITDSGDPEAALRQKYKDPYDRERFANIEGVIGSQGNDRLLGNSSANALYGNGGHDLIEGGSGDDRLGFGAVQPLSDVFSFPGGTGGAQWLDGSSSSRSTSLALELSRLDPEKESNPNGADHDYTAPVGTLQIDSNGRTVEVGSLLWGQAGNDTLDMRFDRGLDFFPDRSDNYAWVDLNVAPDDAPDNSHTGEQLQYGRAEWRDTSGYVISRATTFGIENVIGSRDDDLIIGDRNDNIIEGGGGADFMDGDAGFDTLSYELSNGGVSIRFETMGSGSFQTASQTVFSGDAGGDSAREFEAFRATKYDDFVGFGSGISFYDLFDASIPAGDFSYLSIDVIETDRPIEMSLGEGDDRADVFSVGLQSYDMGAGDDIIRFREGMGITAHLGAGDDLARISSMTWGYGSFVDKEYRTTTIFGGDGLDAVEFLGPIHSLTFDGGRWVAEIAPDLRVFALGGPATDDATDAVNEAYGGATWFEMEGIEAIVIDGQTMRLDSVDPVMGDDFTLSFAEDFIEPFALNIAVPEDEAEATYLIKVLPFGAQIVDGDGTALAVDMVISAVQLAALQAVPGQDYGQGPGLFIYDRVDAQEAIQTQVLPAAAPGELFDLGVAVPEEAGEYRLINLPTGAEIRDADGNVLSAGQVITAQQMAGAQAAAGPDYALEPQQLVFALEVTPPRRVDLLSQPQLQGIALDLDIPTDPLGGALTLTVRDLPFSSELPVATDEAEKPGFGDMFVPGHTRVGGDVISARVVKVGDTLTAEEVGLLRYIPEQNATGVVGQFTLEADTGTGLRRVGEFLPDETQDGIATQTVTFEIMPQDDAPDISRLLFPMSPQGELRGTVSAIDPDGDDFTLSVVDAPQLGTLVFGPDGGFVYQQDSQITFDDTGFVDDFFTVEALQENGLSSGIKTQTIRIISPDFVSPIVFDETRPELFFETEIDEDGELVVTDRPIALGGLGTDDMIVGHRGPDKLFGFGGNDILQGGEGNDELKGGDGDDTLEGGMGANRHELGRGKDMVKGTAAELNGDRISDFDEEDGVFIKGLVAGAGQVSVSPVLRYVPFSATTSGSSINDAFINTSGLGPDDGVSGGSDLIPTQARFDVDTDGDGTTDAEFWMDGGYVGQSFEVLNVDGGTLIRLAEAGATQLTAASERFSIREEVPQRVFGDDGDDAILADGGADLLSGGAGEDVINGAAGNDILIGGRGFDRLTGGSGADLFVINASDYVTGRFTVDTITDFTPGEDVIQLGGFGDLVPADLTFNDISNGIYFSVGAGHLVVLEGLSQGNIQDSDIVVTSVQQSFELLSVEPVYELTATDDTFFLDEDVAIVVNAGDGDDVVFGAAEPDILRGEAGDDLLSGGSGNDRLIGGAGFDQLRGGEGADVFVFDLSGVDRANATIDVIDDFEIGIDRIEIQGDVSDFSPSIIRDIGEAIFVSLTPSAILQLNSLTAQEFTANSDQMFEFV